MHHALEIVGNTFLTNCLVNCFNNDVSCFLPADMFKHHNTRKNNRAGVDFIQIGIFRCRPVGCLKDGVTGYIIYIGARRDTDSTDLSCQGIRKKITLQIHCGNNIKLLGTGQNLLQCNIRNGVLDHEQFFPLAVTMGCHQLQGCFYFTANIVLLSG